MGSVVGLEGQGAGGEAGAASPLLMVFDVVRAARKRRFPAVLASKTQYSTTVPQLAVGAGKVMAALLEMVPLVPVLAVVLPADWVPAQLARDDVTATRA